MKKVIGTIVVIVAVAVITMGLSSGIDAQPAQSSRLLQQDSQKIQPATNNSGAVKLRNTTTGSSGQPIDPVDISNSTIITTTNTSTDSSKFSASGSTVLTPPVIIGGISVFTPETTLTTPVPTTMLFFSRPDRRHCVAVGNTVTYGWQEWKKAFPFGSYKFKPGAKKSDFSTPQDAAAWCADYNAYVAPLNNP